MIRVPIVESPDETLEVWHQVYEGCAEEDIAHRVQSHEHGISAEHNRSTSLILPSAAVSSKFEMRPDPKRVLIWKALTRVYQG